MATTTDSYRNTSIMTASPMELILILYDEAGKSLLKAEESFKLEGPERIQEVNNNILRAQNIITELTASLNFEKGGEIAANLYKLYEFMSYQLGQANAKKEKKPIIEVRKLMSELREAWTKVAEHEPLGDEAPARQMQGIMIAG